MDFAAQHSDARYVLTQPNRSLAAADENDHQVSGTLRDETAPIEQSQSPIRVVIPAYWSSNTIRDVVSATLRSRTNLSLQVVVVDDGGNGDLELLLSGMAVRIVSTGGCGSAAVARNVGAEGFTGRFLVFIDADVLVHELCVETLLEPLRSGRADATVGNYSRSVAGLPFAARYKQLYISKIYQRREGYLQNEFWAAVGAIDARVFRDLNGFDSGFTGAAGEDTDLGRRLTEGNFRTLAVPEALGDHRHFLSLMQLIRNDWRKGLSAMSNYFQSEGSLSDNRHATRRDMLAAGIATMALAFTVAPVFGYPITRTLIALGILAIGYMASRADVLRVFFSQGALFAAGACVLMPWLDLMRSACVVASMSHWLISRPAEAVDEHPPMAPSIPSWKRLAARGNKSFEWFVKLRGESLHADSASLSTGSFTQTTDGARSADAGLSADVRHQPL